VAPGFVNMMSWANESLIEDGRSQSNIRQGVTLEIMGEGNSMGPLNDAMKDEMRSLQSDIRYDIEWTTLDEYLEFLKLRRSVRVFKDKPVERELIEKILEAASTAPMGIPPHSTEVVVIDERKELDFLLEELVKDYSSMVKAFANPIGRAIVRLSAGAEDFAVLKDYIVDLARYANEAYHRDGTDRYMYKAPVVMLFHGNRWAMSYEENAHLICNYAMLAAVSLGLGNTIIGLIPPIVDRSKVLRERYGIPKDNKVCTSLILGYPKYRYKKSIHRDLAGVQYH